MISAISSYLLTTRLGDQKDQDATIARIGGDEFVILLPNLAPDQKLSAERAEEQANEVRLAISEPFYIHGHEYHISASIGISLFPESDKHSAAF